MNHDWSTLCERAARVMVEQIRTDASDAGGLHPYQLDIALHVLNHLRTHPGIIVAERTGRGKTLIATSVLASLARAHADDDNAKRPFRVGLLAPSQQVLENWCDRLLPEALDLPDSRTFLWRSAVAPLDWALSGLKRAAPRRADLVVYAAHYGHGIASQYPTWSRTKAGRVQRAREFLGGERPQALDLLITDEAHQLKKEGVNRGAALKVLFGEPGCPIPVSRVLLLTATPFQLNAAPELYRLMKLLAYPHANGGPDLPEPARPYRNILVLAELFDRYRVDVARWLTLRMREGTDANVGASLERQAVARKDEVEALLRALMVRTHAPTPHVQTRYGRPHPEEANDLPDPASGIPVEAPNERLLFLAWDGSIAARTTFVAAEQQTLSSSAEALRCRQETAAASPAAERFRKPIAPPSVQQALFKLAAKLAHLVDPDHSKVLATADAIARRASANDTRHPTVVFVERTATLEQLQRRLKALAPRVDAEIVSGDQTLREREDLLRRFNGHAGRPVQVLLASKVAEMGLDVDGPEKKEDIWLIHHDFPWNPAMVDQRNGRVCRPAKAQAATPAPVQVTYPFLRDTVDERIFKRMLMRQALAELLLGTDDVARALRLGDHDSLEGLILERVKSAELRILTPDLSPPERGTAPSLEVRPDVMGTSDETALLPPDEPLLGPAAPCAAETLESVRAPDPSVMRSAASIGMSPTSSMEEGARPGWCPIDLIEAAERRSAAPLSSEPNVAGVVDGVVDELGALRFDSNGVTYLRMELGVRKQALALLLRRPGELVVEMLSLADASVDSRDKLGEAFRLNGLPGAAGLVLVRNSANTEQLFARAANLAATLQDAELRRMIDDTAKLADECEARFYGEVDRW